MLSAILGGNRVFDAVKKFLYSPWYIAVVSALGACSNLFGWELPVWYVMAFLAVLVLLFADDALPIVPMIGSCYISVSASNNPAGHYGTSLFQNSSSLMQLAVIAAVLAVVLMGRIVFDLVKPKLVWRKRTQPQLAVGLWLLSLAYLLAGLTPGQDYGPQWKSAMFGLVQSACLIVPYFYFHHTIDWRRVDPTYLPKVFVGLGFAIAAEIVGMYVFAFQSLQPGEKFVRDLLVTGWGIYNNVGFLMAFCIPFAFNMVLRSRRGWIYAIVAMVFETALIFTQSRGSILFGTAVFLACLVYMCVKLKGKNRWTAIGAGVGFCLVCGVLAIVFRSQISELFNKMSEAGMDDSGRWAIYREGLRQFSQSPQSIFLGNGFYACNNYRYGDLPADAFLPPRYHNTIVQLLATGGLTALVAYAFHRYQTIRLCLVRRTPEKIFTLAAIAVLVLCSMVDCHFFNMGPGLVYAIALVFAEDVGAKSTELRQSQQT